MSLYVINTYLIMKHFLKLHNIRVALASPQQVYFLSAVNAAAHNFYSILYPCLSMPALATNRKTTITKYAAIQI
jgi:hypothetical protein